MAAPKIIASKSYLVYLENNNHNILYHQDFLIWNPKSLFFGISFSYLLIAKYLVSGPIFANATQFWLHLFGPSIGTKYDIGNQEPKDTIGWPPHSIDLQDVIITVELRQWMPPSTTKFWRKQTVGGWRWFKTISLAGYGRGLCQIWDWTSTINVFSKVGVSPPSIPPLTFKLWLWPNDYGTAPRR